MGHDVHSIGDIVVLKAGLTRTAGDERVGRIVGQLPNADSGERQYRVRLDSESFERRIVASDIDASETAESTGGSESSSRKAGEPWLKPWSMRVGK